MAKFDLGKYKLTPRGEYNEATAYEALDVVTYNFSSYLVLKDITGITPDDDGVNYQLLSGGVNPDELNLKASKNQSNNLFVGHSWTYGNDINSSTGRIVTSSYSSISDLILIHPNTTYTINIFNVDYKRQIFAFFYNENQEYISAIGRVQLTDDWLTDKSFVTFTTPDNSEISYIRLRLYASYGTEESMFLEKTLLSKGNIAIEPLNDNQLEDVEFSDYQKEKINALPLANKRLVNFGDSIAAGVSGTSYSQQIARKNYMLLKSKAKGGATIRVVENNDNNVLNQINNYTPTIIPDFVLLEGLTNDALPDIYEETKLGEISDGFAAELDTSTFCGAFETILKTAMSKYLGAKIIYITTHINKNRDYNAQKTLTELAIQMCEKWGVTIVDMFHAGGLNSFIDEHFYTYINDGSHPNTLGYATFYVPMIEGKMKALAN